MNELLLAIVAALGFAGAGLLGVLGVGVSTTIRLASVAVAAGILLAISVADLIPEALEAVGRRDASFGFVIGFLILFSMEALTKAHVHHHGDDDEALHHHDLHEHHHSSMGFILGLSLHNLADGLAIGTTTGLSDAAAAAVTAGVLIHQLPVGISFAAVLTSQHASKKETLRAALFCAAMIPLGTGVILVVPNITDHTIGVLIAAAAGALTYVASGHLLPEAHSEQRHSIVIPVFAIALVATTAWFTLVSTG